MPVNDDILDALTRHAIGLSRLSTSTVRRIMKLLNASDKRIFERLMRDDLTDLGRRRQEALLRDIRRIIDTIYTEVTGQLRLELEDLAEYEVGYQLDMFKRVLPIDVDFNAPSPDIIRAAAISRPFAGRYLREWFKELEEGAFRRLRDTIRMGMVENQTNAELVRQIRGTAAQGFKDGILQQNRHAVAATVRTATNHVANAARESLYSRNKRFIKGVQMSATLDGRTSVRCRAVDGAVAVLEGFKRSDFEGGTIFLKDLPSFTNDSRPPFHPNCRTSSIPVLKSFRDIGLNIDVPRSTRASMNGQVAEDITYNDWLRKQPIAFQNDVLGKRKAQLFRKGDLHLSRFVDRNGQEYTLDELRQREREVWKEVFGE